LKLAWANSSQDPVSKKPIIKKGWWSGLSGENLPSKCEVLSSNPSAAKKRKKFHPPQIFIKHITLLNTS
jgi:hypothetical protein